MSHVERFAELELGEEALLTPVGAMPLSEITRAEFVREIVKAGPGTSHQETSVPAVAGGAVVGGALFGTAGAVVGGLVGSTVKEDVPDPPELSKNSVTIVFETNDRAYSMDVARDKEMAADKFVKAVKKAVKRYGG